MQPYGYPRQPPQYGPPSDDIIAAPGTHPATMAIVISCFCGWGAGAMANRQLLKGLIFVFLVLPVALGTCYFGLLIWYPLGIADTVMIANRINRGEPVGQWKFF